MYWTGMVKKCFALRVRGTSLHAWFWVLFFRHCRNSIRFGFPCPSHGHFWLRQPQKTHRGGPSEIWKGKWANDIVSVQGLRRGRGLGAWDPTFGQLGSYLWFSLRTYPFQETKGSQKRDIFKVSIAFPSIYGTQIWKLLRGTMTPDLLACDCLRRSAPHLSMRSAAQWQVIRVTIVNTTQLLSYMLSYLSLPD